MSLTIYLIIISRGVSSRGLSIGGIMIGGGGLLLFYIISAIVSLKKKAQESDAQD